MRTLLLLLFCHISSTVRHSLKFCITASTGIQNIPEVVATLEIDELVLLYCDSNTRLDVKQDIAKSFFREYPEQLQFYRERCLHVLPKYKSYIKSLMSLYNQREGVHVLQRVDEVHLFNDFEDGFHGFTRFGYDGQNLMDFGDHVFQEDYGFPQYGYDGEDSLEFVTVSEAGGSEWDYGTPDYGFPQYGYDGEDSMEFGGSEWNYSNPDYGFHNYGYNGDFMAYTTPTTIRPEQIWAADEDFRQFYKTAFTEIYPDHLKKYVKYGRNSGLLRTDLPSVSLLRRTPSSPVSCLATGFYPHRASLFWREDGLDLDEEVDHGEILPNHDGTFQMSVDLNRSLVTPEDWTRYDCVFVIYGVKREGIVTKLEKDRIRTNEVKSSNMTVLVTAAVVVLVLALILIGAAGFIVYKKKKAISPPSSINPPFSISPPFSPDNSVELPDWPCPKV